MSYPSTFPSTLSQQEEEEAPACLVDLPTDVLLSIAQQLHPSDVANLSRTCTFFADLTRSEAHCSLACDEWLRRNCDPAETPPSTSADLKSLVQCASFRALHRYLYQELVCSPVGLWQRTNEGTDGGLPYGQLALVTMTADGVLTAFEVGELGLGVAPHVLWTLRAAPESGAACTRVTMQFGPGESPRLAPISETGCVRLLRDAATDATLLTVQYDAADELSHVYTYRKLKSLPQAVKGDGLDLPEDPTQLAARLNGLWTACYGSHGLEIILIEAKSPGEAAPPGSPIGATAQRIEGLKVTGDPNVPASKVSFIADLASWVRGPTTNDEVSGLHHGEPDLRPILTFGSRGRLVSNVDLQERGVVGRCTTSFGQINRHPPVWAPEWDHAVFMIYAQDGELRCGILFHERSENMGFRHVIEFSRLPLPRQPSWRVPGPKVAPTKN